MKHPIILTAGVYDILHIGHVELFRKAKALGGSLVVAVQRSEDVARFKPGAEPVGSTDERSYMVRAVRYVDEVVEYSSVDDLCGRVDFDVFVKGPDQNHSAFRAVGKWCEENGKKIVTLPRTDGISSSRLKELIKSM